MSPPPPPGRDPEEGPGEGVGNLDTRTRIALKFILALSLVSLAFAATYTSSAATFSESDLHSILLFGGAVNAIALLGALLPSLLPSRSVVMADMTNALLSLVVLASVATAYVIHTDLYLTGNRAVLIALCAMFGAGVFIALRVIDEQRLGGVALTTAALLGLGTIVGGHLSNRDAPVRGDVSNIRGVSFRETPNLYFVSFDSAIPRSLLEKHLGLETTDFLDVFDAHFRRFPNFFVNAVRTKHSLNTLLALSVDVYRSQQTELRERGEDRLDPELFSGQNPSPLLEILHKNGYETTFIYVDSYFGRQKGSYIDNYITFSDNTVCNLLDAGIRDISFWGYCRFLVGSGVDWNTGLTLSAEQVTKASAEDGLQFVMLHLPVPNHTDRSFRYDDAEAFERFRARYVERSQMAAGYLELIIRHLEENDPDAILLVYGDHGPFVSYGVEFEDSPEFVVQDHYGVLGGVYPRDTCAAEFDGDYMTILDAVHALLRCLSGGQSALIEPREHTLRGYRSIPWNVDYRELLYE